jgi:hypothetical protein
MIEDHVLSTYFMNPLVPIWWPQYSVISMILSIATRSVWIMALASAPVMRSFGLLTRPASKWTYSAFLRRAAVGCSMSRYVSCSKSR